MLAGSCEKMVLISSTSNEWPLQKNLDGRSLMGSSGARVMEKPMDGQDQPPLPPPAPTQQPLKCPRCDSSNTKFCYYNNYSLSQPRHFCKACKRYWTRGGTLRNVPVGGGCRKNKRIKRPSAPSISSSSSLSLSSQPSSSPTPPNLQPQIDSSAQNHINPLLYGLPTTHTNPSFPRMFNSRVSNFESTISGFNNMGLGFSSYENGFPNTSSSSLLSSYNPVFGSSSSSSSSTTLASLIASSLHQGGNNNGFHGISSSPYGEMQVAGNLGGREMGKEVKMEGENGQNRLNNHWNNGGVSSHYEIINQNNGQINSSSDHNNNNNNNPLSWNNGGSWFDPSNMGSSVPSLI